MGSTPNKILYIKKCFSIRKWFLLTFVEFQVSVADIAAVFVADFARVLPKIVLIDPRDGKSQQSRSVLVHFDS